MARNDDDFSDSDDYSDLDLDDDDILDLDNDVTSYPARKRALEKSKAKGKGKEADPVNPAKRGRASKGGAEVSCLSHRLMRSGPARRSPLLDHELTACRTDRYRTKALLAGRVASSGVGMPSRRMRRAASRVQLRPSSHEADGGGAPLKPLTSASQGSVLKTMPLSDVS